MMSESLLSLLLVCVLLIVCSHLEVVEGDESSKVGGSFQTSTPATPVSAGDSTGYPQLFTRKTTTLLAEALHMLSRVKDVKERRWLETFVHRLASLADDLERSSGRPGRSENAKGLAEFSKSLAENTDHLRQIIDQRLKESKDGNRSNDSKLEQELQSQPSGDQIQRMLKTNKTPDDDRTKHRENKLRMEKQKELEKTKLLKNIFAEVQRLRELGGKAQDVLDILKRSRGPGQEQQKSSSTVAPTAGHLQEAVTDPRIAQTTAVTRNIKESTEPLPADFAKQLEDEKFILVTSPKEEDDEDYVVGQ